MKITTSLNGDTFIAKLSDRMEFSDHTMFRTLLDDVGNSGARKCVFDLSDLRSIDSSGLGMFMVAHDTATTKGWTLSLKSPQGHVKTLLQLGKFDKILEVLE